MRPGRVVADVADAKDLMIDEPLDDVEDAPSDEQYPGQVSLTPRHEGSDGAAEPQTVEQS